MDGVNQGPQAGVYKLAVRVQFDLAIRFVSGRRQRRIGDTELQMRDVHETDPLAVMTIA